MAVDSKCFISCVGSGASLISANNDIQKLSLLGYLRKIVLNTVAEKIAWACSDESGFHLSCIVSEVNFCFFIDPHQSAVLPSFESTNIIANVRERALRYPVVCVLCKAASALFTIKSSVINLNILGN